MKEQRPGMTKRYRPGILHGWIPVWLCVVTILPPGAAGQNTAVDDERLGRVADAYKELAEYRGREVYEGACAACHGIKGDGNGPAAYALRPKPTDFSSGIFKFRSTHTGELPTDEDLVRSISAGIPRTMMPAWEGLLTEQEILDVVAYIKTFSVDFAEYGQGIPIDIPDETSVTEVVFAEGKYMYMILDCWTCHGASGRGDGISAGALKDDRGRSIEAFDFTTGHYKGGYDNPSIYKSFETGLDGTPMPSYAHAFLFGGDQILDFEPYQKTYTEAEIKALRRYLNSQPPILELDGMTETDRERITTRRKWALVYYMKTLARRPGILYRLFLHNYEVTQ